MKKRKLRKIYLIFSILFISFMITSTVWAGFLCNGLGTGGLTNKSTPAIIDGTADLSHIGQRKYTIFELLGKSSMKYSIPFGETGGDFLRKENKSVSENNTLTKEQEDRLKQIGSSYGCVVDGIAPTFQNMSRNLLGTANNFITSVLGLMFDNNTVCTDPDNPGVGCLDIMGIAGGTEDGTEKGLIGKLGSGVFVPLLVVAFVIVGIYFIWIGLIKRKFREVLTGFLWSIFALALGMLTVVNPYIVARAPQNIVLAMNTCAINVLSGKDCLDTGATANTLSGDELCTSYTDSNSATLGDKSKMYLNSLSCGITKSFLLDNWTMEQFGYAFDDLYTTNAPDGHTLYTKIQGDPLDYCINMYSQSSPDELKTYYTSNTDTAPSTNFLGGQVCNIAAAYMANTSANVHFGQKADMAQIVATAALDERMWASFTGSGRNLFDIIGFIGLLAIGISFIPISIKGIVYSILTMFLMIFSPIFILFGIHPGRGRKIFLKWANDVMTNLLKYMTTCFIVIVMVNIYSFVGKIDASMTRLIVNIILAIVFVKGRSEIEKLLVPSSDGLNMKMPMIEGLKKARDKAAQLGRARVAGAVAGGLASYSENREAGMGIGESLANINGKTVSEGMDTAFGMELRRGTSALANGARAFNQVKKSKQREIERSKKAFEEEKHRQDVLDRMEEQTETIRGQMEENRLENDKSVLIDKISSAIGNTTNTAIKSSLEKTKTSVEATNTRSIPNVSMHYTNTVNEANTLTSYISGKSGNKGHKQKEAVESYINDYKNVYKTEIDSYIKGIQDRYEASDTLNSQITTFRNNEMNNLNNHINELRKNFTITKGASAGQTVLTGADMEKTVIDKSRFKRDFEMRKAMFDFNADSTNQKKE